MIDVVWSCVQTAWEQGGEKRREKENKTKEGRQGEARGGEGKGRGGEGGWEGKHKVKLGLDIVYCNKITDFESGPRREKRKHWSSGA